jgi:hypothetical protein
VFWSSWRPAVSPVGVVARIDGEARSRERAG